jgi:phycocyanin-associated, rod
MLGQSAFSASATVGNRIFVYEVTGLQQNEVTAQCDYQIRTSGSTFMQVPLNRMNQAMQRIVNSGGKIVSIRPLGQEAELSKTFAEEKKKK